jgi:hypothetical protein
MSVHDLVAVLQEQLAVQKEQLEKQKEHFEQQLAAQEDSYGSSRNASNSNWPLKLTATRSRRRLSSKLSRNGNQRRR